ncbi:MAG TPA: hypothetical protein VKA46_30390 [Gemmataceae bacterium]|nr:hypothetical protein [Gemmataceae bacterium]
MLTLCNTNRGRIACGLGGVLVAVLALACLWAFSPSVTAGDDPPAKDVGKVKDPTSTVCPDPLPPPRESSVPPLPAPMPTPNVSEVPTGRIPLLGPTSVRDGTRDPARGDLRIGESAAPPTSVAPPPPDPLLRSTPVPQPQPTAGSQEIKQLVAQLTQIRADREKLDEQERQTIQTIKRKYQEQKRALEQMDRELRQLGINCEETAPEKGVKEPVRQTGHSTKD